MIALWVIAAALWLLAVVAARGVWVWTHESQLGRLTEADMQPGPDWPDFDFHKDVA